MTNQPPPLDAERVSDAKLPLDLAAIDALLTALDGTSLFDCFDDVRKNIDLLVPRVREVLAELQRLRATQRESEYESVPRTAIECELIEAPTSMTIGESVASSPFEACNGESGGESVSVPREVAIAARNCFDNWLHAKNPDPLEKRSLIRSLNALDAALSASQRKECGVAYKVGNGPWIKCECDETMECAACSSTGQRKETP